MSDIREAFEKEFDRLVWEWFQESTIRHHIEGQGGRHIIKRSRFIAEKAAAWGADWQSKKAQGEADLTAWVVFDNSGGPKFIKKYEDGSLAIFDTEAEAETTACRSKSYSYKKVDYYRHPPAPAAVPECPYPCGWKELYSIVVRSSAYLARTLEPGDEVTDGHRETAIRLNTFLLEIVSIMANSDPAPADPQEG